MRTLIIPAILTLALLALPAFAQDAYEEIIVTGSRTNFERYEDNEVPPVIGLKRRADFLIQPVKISGDTRDESKRDEEVYAMLRRAIEAASRSPNIDLATGDDFVVPLTLANYRDIALGRDMRADTSRVAFLIKSPVNEGTDAKAALARIDVFVKSVQPVGRAELLRTDDLTLSVVAPDQYRAQIVDLIAADARTVAARMGSEYRVRLSGADERVRWSRAGLADVFLYLPYGYDVVPAGE